MPCLSYAPFPRHVMEDLSVDKQPGDPSAGDSSYPRDEEGYASGVDMVDPSSAGDDVLGDNEEEKPQVVDLLDFNEDDMMTIQQRMNGNT